MGLAWTVGVLLVTAGLLVYAAVARNIWLLLLAVALFLLACFLGTVLARVRSAAAQGGYPHRPDVERRLPDGSLTTDGYAAAHPDEFPHWANGPQVLEERIDRADWEAWNDALMAPLRQAKEEGKRHG